MTSSPLFISVAESMVIFGPMFHVGCRSASPGVTSASSAADRPRKGPPEAVRISRRTSRRSPPVQALVNRVVLAVDRQDFDGSAPRGLHHQPARHDENLLVGERDSLAGVDRGEHRLEARRARRREQHRVHVGPGDDRHEAGTTGSRERTRPGAAGGQLALQRLQRGVRGHRHGGGREPGHLVGEERRVLTGRERDDAKAVRMRLGHRQRAASDRSRRADDGEAVHQACRYLTNR